VPSESVSSPDRHPVAAGAAAAWPICLGYVPIGMAFGALARKAGLSPLEIGLMSLLVFAGSAQFIAVSMWSAGAGPLSVVATTFVVNLRHLLMSAALSVHFPAARRLSLSILAYGVTDESFAVNLARLREGNWGIRPAIAANQTANLVWLASTVAGGFGGGLIPEGAFGIDYALIAMFLCLLVYQLRERIHLVTAVLAAGLSILLSLALPGNLHVMLASVLAAGAGLWIKRSGRAAR
jgi:4-azaleucine resistance transporter AzlC